MRLSKAEKQYLLDLARRTIARELGLPLPPAAKDQSLSGLSKNRAACFVTLTTDSGRLRGCIGSLESSTALVDNVEKYARLAAFEDPRFQPLEPSEFDSIRIGISVLGEMQPLSSFDAVIIGKHGLSVQSGKHRGVLLAKVAEEFGWSREQFLNHTCEKAGLKPIDREKYAWSFFEEESFEDVA